MTMAAEIKTEWDHLRPPRTILRKKFLSHREALSSNRVEAVVECSSIRNHLIPFCILSLGKLLAVVLKNPLLSTVGFVEEVCWFVLLTSVSRKIERRRQYA